MSAEQQRLVHLFLCEHALEVWEQHYPPGTRSSYQETVTGTIQELDVGLPREALGSIKKGKDIANIASRYSEPKVALQDDDVKFPEDAEFAYYAIYNAFQLHVVGEKIDTWLIVNQALSTVEPSQVLVALQNAVNHVG